MKKVGLKGLALSSLLVVGLVSSGKAAQESTFPLKMIFSVDYSPYYFKWEENVGVDEKGWLHAFETNAEISLPQIAWMPKIMPSFKIYTGDVKYDGQTWSGNSIKSRTDYSGWNGEINFGYDFKITKNIKTTTYAGIGHEYWKRNLENTLNSLGYTEKWTQNYFKVGVKPQYEVGNYYVYTNLYLKRPFDVKNRVSMFNVEVKPDEKWNYGIEVGGGVNSLFKKNVGLFIAGFYEKEKFGKSDPEYSDVIGDYLYQPESKRTTYGIKAGLKF